MDLTRFPRRRLAHLPTPLEPLARLSQHLGGPRLWVKRDDCTGLSTGGNKTRKLEFLLGDALSRGADTVITLGAIQSNHARQTAAGAAKLGLDCHLLLQDRTGDNSPAYTQNGNVLLDNLHGARISKRSASADMDGEAAALAAELQAKGKTPYVIPSGGSNAIGALGYANCALELLYQANESGLKIAHLVHATSSAGTQAGLVAGFGALNADIPVLGISVGADKATQEAGVFDLAQRTADHLGAPNAAQRARVIVDSDYVGAGYGLPTDGMREAVKLAARLEGLVLDPVYTGKAFHGMIDQVRGGAFAKDSDVVFLHTGGAPSLFAYAGAFDFPA